MPAALLALGLLFLVPQPLAAQLDDPGGSCFEPVQPACAEVAVGSEDEGWAMRCREELTSFLEGLEEYQQCVVSRIEDMQERAVSERERMDCLVESELADGEESPDCD